MKTVFLVLILAFTASAQTNVVFWDTDKERCPICDTWTVEGNKFYIFQSKEFFLALMMSYNNKLIATSAYLENTGATRIDFDPSESRIAILKTPKDTVPVEIRPMSPEETAKKMKGNQGFKNFLTAMAGGLAREQVNVDSSVSGNASVVSSNGSGSVIYNENTTATVSVPDKQAQANAQKAIEERNRKAAERQEYYLNNALRANTIFPNQSVQGSIYYPLTKSDFMWVGVTVNGKLYAVPYPGINK